MRDRRRNVYSRHVAVCSRGNPAGSPAGAVAKLENVTRCRAPRSARSCRSTRPVASRFVGAIAADRQVRRVRKRGDQIEHLACIGRLHFRMKRALERSPRPRVVGALSPTSAAPRSARGSAATRRRNRVPRTPPSARRAAAGGRCRDAAPPADAAASRGGRCGPACGAPITAPAWPAACLSRQCRPPSPSSLCRCSSRRARRSRESGRSLPP